MEHVWLHRYSIFVAASTLCLVVAGALVTSQEAGLSVPDWPLSYGKLMPEMTGGIWYEHGHRMVATAVGILTIILALWLWRAEDRRWVRRLGWSALGAVVVQGVLGGLTVIYLLPKPVSISHACLAQLFFAATVAVALFTSRSWRLGPALVDPAGGLPLRTLAPFVPVSVLAQLALGAAYRHKALDLVPHVAGAMVVTALALLASIQVLMAYPRNRALRNSAMALLAIAVLQVFFGVGAYMSRVAAAGSPQPMPVMVLFTVIHVAAGALTMAASVVFAIQVLRNVRRPMMEAPAGGLTATP